MSYDLFKGFMIGDDDNLFSHITNPEILNTLPVEKRKLTDFPYFVLLFISLIVMHIIGLCALGYIPSDVIQPGDPSRLLHGVDYEGHICGVDFPVTDLPYKWFPNANMHNPDNNGKMVPFGLGICVETCPKEGTSISDPYNTYGYWNSTSTTYNIFNYCVSIDEKLINSVAFDAFSDFMQCWDIIAVFGFGFAVAISLSYLVTIRIPGVLRSVVWFCVGIIFVVLAAGTYSLLDKAKVEESRTDIDAMNSNQIYMLKVVGGLLGVLTLSWTCVIFIMRHRIALAVGLVRETASVLLDMPMLCFFPILYTIVFGSFSALWMYYSVYLVSSGKVTTHTDPLTGISYEVLYLDANAGYCIIFLVFIWLWVVGILESYSSLVSSHAVLDWYFKDVEHGQQRNFFQVFYSARICAQYHIGTACLGSIIVALMRLVRLPLQIILRCANPRADPTRLSRMIAHAIYLNKHAYTQCALFSTPFVLSARKGFGLLSRNLGQLAAVTVVGDFVVLIAKMSITLSCAGLAYYYMAYWMDRQVHGYVLPTLMVAFLSFFTCTLMLTVASATADTILQAYIADEEIKKLKNSMLTPEIDIAKTETEMVGISWVSARESEMSTESKNNFPLDDLFLRKWASNPEA